MITKRIFASCAVAIAAATTVPRAHAFDTCEIGARMPDGMICAGLSPETGMPLYALPADAPLIMKWREAMDYAASFESPGQRMGSLRVPTARELGVLYENRNEGALSGTFNETGSDPSWYWSATEDIWSANTGDAWSWRFDDGLVRGWSHKWLKLSVRLVRN